uniref:DUF4220 domain-containing protein n=1 Tax=Oryza punctata TaxID=4537 RepID=A0A0E0LR72_ORYPU
MAPRASVELERNYTVVEVNAKVFGADPIYQVTVAIYVFCKSWSSSADRKLLASAVLLFIPGILKCFTKPIALKTASFNNLVSMYGHVQRAESTSREKELNSFVEKARALIAIQDNLAYKTAFLKYSEYDEELPLSDRKLSMPTELFVDYAYPYSDRLANLEFFYALEWDKAYKRTKLGINNIFGLLYTRDAVTDHNEEALGCCISTWMLTIVLAVTSIVVLHISHKQVYSHYDVIITFMLLYGTLLLDIISVVILLYLSTELADDLTQQSLIGFFTHNKRHTWLIRIAECLQCKGLLDQYWSMKPYDMPKDISYLVIKYVKNGWTKYIQDAESYRRFNDNMGQLALNRAECGELGWSLEKPFDEIVLVWHVATDICFHMSYKASHTTREMGRAISNYMFHLLFANPEMLMAGSRRNLFTTAYSELEDILKHKKDLPVADEGKLMLTIIQNLKSEEGSFIHEAWQLARGLRKLNDEEKRWDVITDVWVQLLCFSAGRCRGYLHAKSLGSGVEYLTIVWLMLAHAGMETFPERLQRTQHLHLPKKEPQREDGDAGPSDCQGLECLNLKDGEDNDAGPSDSQGLKLLNLKEEDVDAPSDNSKGSESCKGKQNHAAPLTNTQGEDVNAPELNEIKVVPL